MKKVLVMVCIVSLIMAAVVQSPAYAIFWLLTGCTSNSGSGGCSCNTSSWAGNAGHWETVCTRVGCTPGWTCPDDFGLDDEGYYYMDCDPVWVEDWESNPCNIGEALE